jgi:hypothetical protein
MLDHEFNAARSISVRLITLDLNLILGLITKGVIRVLMKRDKGKTLRRKLTKQGKPRRTKNFEELKNF